MRKTFFLFCSLLLIHNIVHLQTPILSVDFQQGIPSNFTIVDNDGNTPDPSVSEYSAAWISITDPIDSTDTIAASTSFFTPVGTANRWLITPQISVGAFGNYISWDARSHDPSFPDDYLVLVSTTDNQIASFTDTIGHIIEENYQWTNREINLSDSGFNNQNIYIAFVNTTDDGFKLYIDDIEIRKDDPVSTDLADKLNKINIYPNPVQDYLYIDEQNHFDYLEITSTSGKIIILSSSNKIDLKHLEKGIYYINIYNGLKKINRLIIKY